MSVRQLWEGTDAAGWAQNLNGRTKLLFLFLFAILMITVDNPRTLFILFTFTLLLHLAAKTSIYKWKVMAILLLLGLWGSMFSQALFFAQTPRTPLLVLIAPEAGFIGQLTGGLFIYREGILYGAVQGLRSASMLALGLLVCWTSDPRQLLQALLGWRLPPQMAFMLVTAIRFLPVLAAETGEVITALQLRSDSQRGAAFAVYRQAVVGALPEACADAGAFGCEPWLFRRRRRKATPTVGRTRKGKLPAAVCSSGGSCWQ